MSAPRQEEGWMLRWLLVSQQLSFAGRSMAAPADWVLEACACLGSLCTPGAMTLDGDIQCDQQSLRKWQA